MIELTVNDLHLEYGNNPVLKGVSMQLQKGEVVSLLGPSGSGKTTLLRAVAGLEQASSGTVKIGERVMFDDAAGLRIGQTPVNYRGVQVGEVIGIALSPDRRQAEVKVRLQRDAAPIATEGAQFWIVRPQLGLGNVTGLNTVLSGPEINVRPGNGEKAVSQFNGLDNAPVALGVDRFPGAAETG